MNKKSLLSTLWVLVTLNYLFRFVFSLYYDVRLSELLGGKLHGMNVTQGLLLGMSIMMEVPIIMILLSRLLKHKSNRMLNIMIPLIMGAIHLAKTTNKKGLFLLLGISLVTQATTSLVGGLIGIGPFTKTDSMADAMNNIAGNISGVHIGIFLQIVTSLVIIVLAAALYQAGKSAGKTAAIAAFGFYLTEAIVHIVGQFVIFAIAEVSRQYVSAGDTSLLATASLLFSVRDFIGAITMIPFGLGTILFYFLITKAKIIPKWIGIWGIVTVSFILVGWSLEAFSIVSVPFILYVPYVPWEWVAGIYIFVKGLKTPKIQNHCS